MGLGLDSRSDSHLHLPLNFGFSKLRVETRGVLASFTDSQHSCLIKPFSHKTKRNEISPRKINKIEAVKRNKVRWCTYSLTGSPTGFTKSQ
jgi:hypothetical protein